MWLILTLQFNVMVKSLIPSHVRQKYFSDQPWKKNTAYVTCGWESMSRLQEQILPSVEMLMRLWAFWVPTTLTQYTGCCEEKRGRHFTLLLYWHEISAHRVVQRTVCAAADRGVLCIGVLLLLLLSHSTIWPEYVPPTTTLGWNLANAADITADCRKEVKIEKGTVNVQLL